MAEPVICESQVCKRCKGDLEYKEEYYKPESKNKCDRCHGKGLVYVAAYVVVNKND